ncbi:MAG TPA: 2-oxoacid:ferredoxin oxidoreductase subunit gamma [Candidatus Atribacteria bacterium]|nr:2-oxoacid:ferredoxin oxidoreductase subunit gamma [Candidatus Atribacteria bacterium]
MHEEIVIAGFGGQGVMSMGRLLAYIGMIEGKNVSWFPSYGPEMRGGTANCTVIISSEPIGSPVTSSPTTAIVMNRPSLDKFEPLLKSGGYLFINSSLVDREPERKDIKIYKVPANEIAEEIGNSKVANMVVVGAYIGVTKTFPKEVAIEAMRSSLKKVGEEILDLNEKAIERGYELFK